MPPPAQSLELGQARAQRVWGRRSTSWTAEEDAKLVELVKKESTTPPSITASKTWSRVAAQLTNRTGKQCRERYLNQLKPGIRRDPWSPEEERILRETHARIGNKWVTIANQLPGRTDNCVKNHWNSMLRKRQRREAALKAAQAEVVATLGKAQPPPIEIDRKSEAEYSMRTGCATPSGASSSFHDIPTSGIPSPYTASSPITPRRDSKLQISSLVAASTKELPTWQVPFVGNETGRFGNLYASRNGESVNGKREITILGGHESTSGKIPLLSPSPQALPPAFVQQSGGIGTQREATMQLIETGELAAKNSFMSKNLSPMQCIASSSRVPQLIQSARSDENGSSAGLGRQVRRSSRLISSMKEKGGVRPAFSGSVSGVQKRTVSKARSLSEGVGTNALAALAAAASSVPPSPLTPESRFSTTSRSRSVSPESRLWAVPSKSKRITGSSRLDGRSVRRRTSERGGAVNEGSGGGQDDREKRECAPTNEQKGAGEI